MELPRLTIEQLSKLVASNSPPSQLFEALTEYEQEACLMTEGSGRSEGAISNPELLSLFYSSFFLVHLLTDQMSVTPNGAYTVISILTDPNRSEAHALTKRMPTKLKHEDPSLQNCLALLRAVWQTEHGQVYRILQELPWPEAVRPLVQRYESMSSMRVELLLVEANICGLLFRFFPRQDLDLSEQVLRNHQTVCRRILPRFRSRFSGARGSKHHSKLHKVWMEMGPGYKAVAS